MTSEDEQRLYFLIKDIQCQLYELRASEAATLELLERLRDKVSPEVSEIISGYVSRRDHFLKKILLEIGDGDPNLAEEFGKRWPNVRPEKPEDPNGV